MDSFLHDKNFTFDNCSVNRYQNEVFNQMLGENIPSYTFYLFGVVIWSISLNAEIKELDFKKIQNSYIARPVFYFLSCFVFPLFLVVFVFLSGLKTVTDFCLRKKYGPLYGGLLSGGDAVWAVEDISKSIINALVILEENNDDANSIIDTRQKIIEKITKHVKEFEKLRCLRQTNAGYTYLLKNQVDINECVKIVEIGDKSVTKSELEQFLSCYSNKQLPNEGNALWEIIILSKLTECSGQKCVPVLCRFSHIIGDGLALTSVLSAIFGDELTTPGDYINHISKYIKVVKQSKGRWSKLRNVFHFADVVMMMPFFVFHQNYLRRLDYSILHGPQLTGDKILVYIVEEQQRLVDAVKQMKKLLVTVSFFEIILTALSSSLESHFKKHSSVIPEFVTIAFPIMMFSSDETPIIELKNNFSIAMLDLPIHITSSSMLKRLMAVKQQMNYLKNSDDFLMNYLLVNKLTPMIPQRVLKKALQTNNLTLTASNLPGLPEISILNGSKVRDIVFFTPHRGATGIGFTFLTYDNRFHVGLSVDKAILYSKSNAQELCCNILEHIERMYQELLSSGLHTKSKDVKHY